jgi:DNA topoisomerase-2
MDSLHDDSLLSNTPPVAKKQKKAPVAKSGSQPLAEVENESYAVDGASEPKAKKKGATDQYQKLTQLEHILKRPDTYIGSVEATTEQMWAFNSETVSMENRKVTFVPGLYKIFDEILVNAADNKQRDKNMNELRVEVNREDGMISVRNNGRGIPVEMHEKEGIWIPEMIFGHLLTSSNYDDEEAKVTGGRNGYGAKLTNIYSTEFSLETVDSKSKQRYRQTWRNNMSVMEKARIDKIKGDDYTKITFKPDFKKFGMDAMDDDFEALVKRRVYDMAGTCTGIKVYLNGERIKITKFKQYMEMYTKAIKTENLADNGSAPEQVILTDNPHERWEIGFAVSDGSFQQVSFVNSIATTHGGTHVNYVADQIIDKLEEIVMKKNKGGVKLKKAQIKNHIFLFVNCLIVNPAFTSQTKEQLTTKASAFGSKPQVTDKFLKDIAKTEAVTNIIHFAQQKADKVLSKSDGNRRQRMNNSKLTDANKAGTKDGYKCTLILTEGDSASGLALAGRAVVNPDLFGVFPLRGKMLNVRDASIDQISKNAEIQNIKKFMGLQHKKEYTDTKGLRYGHLMIMTDQDHDGSHIKGLLINFLQVQFPSLLKLPGFLMEFITPIVKVWKGDVKHPKQKRDFFTMPQYEEWKAEPGHQKGWEHKYFKGLGTNDTTDAEIYFADLDKHLKEFHTMQEGEAELIDLAFSKKKADARKGWLQEFKPGTYLDMAGTDRITYNDFINKELILFSMADNQRSIPSVVDGFKPGQRKVLYTCFRRNLKKDIKVVELAGSVSGLTAYSYGETSLQQTIVGLAQNYVGSNNINCLEPSGNFGSRLQGGQDAASARYIYTRLSPFARRIFHQSDEPLLTYNTDDGKQIEPEVYMPIVPMILINGADGIGTGWSTSIPNYNPVDVINNLKARMQPGADMNSMTMMKPWFRGWTGEVEDIGGERYKFSGRITETGECEVEITELPVRLWTQTFKDRLEDIIKAEKTPSFIKDYTEYNTPAKVHFIVKLEESKMKLIRGNDKAIEETFKLSTTMATTNMVAFDAEGRIKKYDSVLKIMEDFYEVRIRGYQERRKLMIREMEKEHARLTNQARFVKAIIDGDLVVSKKKKAVLVAELDKARYMRFPKVADAKKQGEFEAVVEQDDDESEDAEVTAGGSDFDYLLGMAIWSLTQERVDKLHGQIADKEAELDALLQKSATDLWNADLDELLEEWQTQLDEAEARAKKVKNKGRRTSAKLGIGAKGGKKRKVDSDDDSDADFVTKKPKAAPKAAPKKKAAASSALASLKMEDDDDFPMVNGIEQKPVVRPAAAQQTTLDSAFDRLKSVSSTSTPEVEATAGATKKAATKVPTKAAAAKAPATKAAPKKKIVDLSDEDEYDFLAVAKEAPAKAAAKAPAAKAAPKKKIVDLSDEDEDDFLAIAKEAPAKPAARGGRAAAQKAKSYKVPDDSDEDMSDGNDRLDDVSAMVKGIGAGAGEGATRFFHPPSAVRPTSSGLKARKRIVDEEDISADETDWAALAQNSPAKATDRTLLSEEGSDDMEPPTPKPVSKVAAKLKATAAPKTNGTLKPKKATAPAPAPAPKTLSPAAKAYAAKQAKAGAAKAAPSRLKKVISDDEDESVNAIANDILSDDDEDLESPAPVPAKKAAPAAAARPSRRAAAAKPKTKYALSDEDDEDDFDQESEEEDAFDMDESD